MWFRSLPKTSTYIYEIATKKWKCPWYFESFRSELVLYILYYLWFSIPAFCLSPCSSAAVLLILEYSVGNPSVYVPLCQSGLSCVPETIMYNSDSDSSNSHSCSTRFHSMFKSAFYSWSNHTICILNCVHVLSSCVLADRFIYCTNCKYTPLLIWKLFNIIWK
jgi:hypothetical protein